MSAMPNQARREVSVAECLAPSRSISVEQLAKEENEMLLGLLRLRAQHG
jgi:ribosomal protein L29